MNNGNLYFNYLKLKEVFGRYPQPVNVSGEPKEHWQELVVKELLSEISIDTMDAALRHIFPGHYGNAKIFKYLFSKAIEMSFLDESAWMIKDIRRGFNNEIRYNTCVRCCEWKREFSDEEISVTETLFKALFQNHFNYNGFISPFYFNFFLLWNKEFPDLPSIGIYDTEAINQLKERLFDAIYGNDVNDSNLSATDILFGQTCYHFPIDKKFENRDLYRWYVESIDLHPYRFRSFFNNNEINAINTQIKDFIEE